MSLHAVEQRYVLGLDIGTGSVGWAAIRVDAEERPQEILAIGARVFEAGVEGDIEQGKDSSRAVVRRQKRLMRRQLWRRARRRRKVLRLLQRQGLMPTGATEKPEDCHKLVMTLDGELRGKWCREGETTDVHTWPYRLRAAALDGKLEALELGRALYHLAHRRGFLSNRKTDRQKDEDGGVTTKKRAADSDKDESLTPREKEGKLRQEIAQGRCRTLGEFFSTLNPELKRIRQRWTARAMYVEEFGAIIAAQKKHHASVLTNEFVAALKSAVFAQRPLRSSRHLIGKCELEPGKRRAALALPAAQRFRLLAAVNNLAVFEPNGTKRWLSVAERDKVIGALTMEGDQTFNELRKLLELKGDRSKKDKVTGEKVNEPGYVFNLEREGGEKKIPGDRTGVKLRVIFPNWDAMRSDEREDIVHMLCGTDRGEVVERLGKERWKLDDARAKALADVHLEEGRARFSRVALERLVSRMEEGLPYMTAQKDEYGMGEGKAAVDKLPPVLEALSGLKNPAVCRALSEVRKIVNGCVAALGKPAAIRIELARDLKRPRKDRIRMSENNREQEQSRNSALARIVKESGVPNPHRPDVEKVLLADECGWKCPYTGRTITMGSLFGAEPQFDVEHIVPLSVSLDNTFRNKTLCYHEENRHGKRNRTPFEAYADNGEKWNEILLRVRRFNGPAAKGKLESFLMTPEEVAKRYGDFTERHLADTRYASRLAAEYVALLYGGLWDETGKRRVQATSGGVTGILRNEWGFNGILNDGGFKTRSDHRHHAVDAAVIAMASPGMIKQLADAAERAWQPGGRRPFGISQPPMAMDEIRKRVQQIVVSHRCDHRVAGGLHAETSYGKQLPKNGGKKAHRVRVRIEAIKNPGKLDDSGNYVGDIVDGRIGKIIVQALKGGKPDVVFKQRENHPCLATKDGRLIPIHRVRIWVDVKPRTVGAGARQRFVGSSTESNHHTVIVAEGNKWEDFPVDRLEVYRRMAVKEPVVQLDWGLGKAVVMWLCKGDMIEMDDGPGKRTIFVIRGISKSFITVMPHNDARTGKEVKEAGERNKFIISSANTLRQRRARKVTITPMGRVIYTDQYCIEK